MSSSKRHPEGEALTAHCNSRKPFFSATTKQLDTDVLTLGKKAGDKLYQRLRKKSVFTLCSLKAENLSIQAPVRAADKIDQNIIGLK